MADQDRLASAATPMRDTVKGVFDAIEDAFLARRDAVQGKF